MAQPDSSSSYSNAPRPKGTGNPILDRHLPYDPDAEQALLACCIIGQGQDGLDTCVQARITAESFYNPAHRLIFETLLDLSRDNIAIDLITVGDRLRARGIYEDVGGAPYVNEIFDRIETPGLINEYIRIVRNNAILRRLIHISQQTIEDIGKGMPDVEHFVNKVEEDIFKIGDMGESDKATTMPEMMKSATEQIQKMLTNKGQVTGITTGFRTLDGLTGGFKPNQMIVIAARPGMGKTSIALNMIEAAILPAPGKPIVPTLMFSLEMGADELGLRMLCCRARVSGTKLREGKTNREEEQELARTAGEMSKVPFFVDDTAGMTILELRAKARRIKKKHNIGLVVVDYLQLLNGTDARAPREQQIAEISRGIKGMAKELALPVVTLAQLNRESERERRQPRMSDLRESGSIEQDADIVMFIARKDKEDVLEGAQDSFHDPRDLIIAKQRSGPTDKVDVIFSRSITRFDEAAH